MQETSAFRVRLSSWILDTRNAFRNGTDACGLHSGLELLLCTIGDCSVNIVLPHFTTAGTQCTGFVVFGSMHGCIAKTKRSDTINESRRLTRC